MPQIYTTRSRFPGLLFPTAWYYCHLATDRLLTDFGVKFEKVGTIIENNMRRDMYYPMTTALAFQKNFIQKILTETNFVDNFKQQFVADGENFLEFIRKNEDIDSTIIPNHQLLDLYNEV